MKIDGKQIASSILENLKKRTLILKEKGTNPHLVVILVGEDSASKAYVRQKELKALEIGAKITIINLGSDISEAHLIKTIEQFNNDNNVHGLIVQRPLPPQISCDKISLAVDPKKDIDSLHPDSSFPMPLAAAVLKILKEIYEKDIEGITETNETKKFISWLKGKKIAVIGKGKTGGKPVINMLIKMGVELDVIDHSTKNPKDLTKKADLIISAVGKPDILTSKNIKKGSILICVGMFKGSDNKLHGDYEEEEIKDKASFYTPVPGGVGPVNVAMLLENLITGTEDSSN